MAAVTRRSHRCVRVRVRPSVRRRPCPSLARSSRSRSLSVFVRQRSERERESGAREGSTKGAEKGHRTRKVHLRIWLLSAMKNSAHRITVSVPQSGEWEISTLCYSVRLWLR